MKKLFYSSIAILTAVVAFSLNFQNSNLSTSNAFADTVHCVAEADAICSMERVGGPILQHYRPVPAPPKQEISMQ